MPEMITIALVQGNRPSDQCPIAFVERTGGLEAGDVFSLITSSVSEEAD